MKKTGFFGGTFDPIHFGHINLAIQLAEIHALDEVLFCPAGRSPFKASRPPLAFAEDRIMMVKLAIQEIDAFRVSSIEIQRKGLSYTIDTLRALKESYKPQTQWYILLSEDSLSCFHLWKEPEEIIRMAWPLIGSRSSVRPEIPPSPVREALLEGLTETKQYEISSTDIRDRLKKGLYCGHLVPSKVLEYIAQRRLYCE